MSGAPRLSHTLQSRHVAMISLGGIIGAGLFVGSSAAIASIGPAVILCYILAGILILLTMRMLSELAVGLSGVNFFTDYARKVLGHPFGFVGGWLYWYFWMVVVAVEAIAGASIIAQWVPLPSWLIGLGLLACLTGVNLMSARSYGEFEFWFSSIKVAAIIAFILVTGSYVFGLMPGHGMDFSGLTAYGGFAPHGALSVLAGRGNRDLFPHRGGDHHRGGGGVERAGQGDRLHVHHADGPRRAVLCALHLLRGRGGELDHHQVRSLALHRRAQPDRHPRRGAGDEHHCADGSFVLPQFRSLRHLARLVRAGRSGGCAGSR